MPAAYEVRPGKWSNIRVLFDNGWYSVIGGDYEGEASFVERWNGDDDEVGFPNQAGHPIWHVIPPFLQIPILSGLLDELGRSSHEDRHKQARAVERELARLKAVRQA